MTYNSKIHHRRTIRLKNYDYAQAGLYFITICCQNRAHLFGEIINGEMKLNDHGKIAYEEWKQTEKIRRNCFIHEFIIMPNHIHGIIEITCNKGKEELIGKFHSPTQTIGSFIRGFKIATIKRIKEKILEENLNSSNSSTGELQFAPTAPTATIGSIDPTEYIKKLNFKIWQRNYYEHIIRDENSNYRISEYIKNNPKKWEQDMNQLKMNKIN